MARTHQTCELLTVEEMEGMRLVLEKSIAALKEAEELCKEKGVPGLFVLYKSGVIRAADSLRRVQGSVNQSVTATRLGKPMTGDSITPRAKRIAKAKQQVLEVRAQIKESKDANRKQK